MTGLAIDSRRVQPGDVFVAFAGERVDGHDHVADAIQRGACAAMVTRPVSLPAQHDAALIQVDDALAAVQRLAKAERRTFDGPVIGVTGSNGKTTTKDLLAAVMSAAGPCLATTGNHNNELGLPLTLLARRDEHRTMVLEMGMRGLGQIAALCDIARPTAGVITNIGQSHLELLGSQENIAKAKGELLEALPVDGLAVLTRDDPWLLRLGQSAPCRVLWHSLEDPDADGYAHSIRTHPHGVSFTARVLGQSATVDLPLVGAHNVRNALAALTMGAAHGISLETMAAALRTVEITSGRLQMRPGHNGWTVIDDTYNASPLSMAASLSTLRDIAQGRPTAAVLGDMYELGQLAESGHRQVGEAVAVNGVEHLIAVGPMAAWIAEAAEAAGCPRVTHIAATEQAVAQVPALLAPNAVVLVKGSRGMHLEDVVRALL
ncbi:UDP-N-acetylmuramoyl-tripeptide--D-alanyl-D-alanine ligase [Alicyclobacillus contaminans]|nr:UDP-N-acetylmuramoyl-tripeptide--D-alanyl-D-alanine ligase [Alicyclobacillus contaminans]